MRIVVSGSEANEPNLIIHQSAGEGKWLETRRRVLRNPTEFVIVDPRSRYCRSDFLTWLVHERAPRRLCRLECQRRYTAGLFFLAIAGGLMRALQLGTGAFAILSLGCSGPQPLRDYDAVGRRVLQLVQQGDSEALLPLLDPALTSSAAQAEVRATGDTLRAWAADSVALIGWNLVSEPNRKAAQLSYELRGPHRWGAAVLWLEKRVDGTRLNGLRLFARTQSMASENAFTLRDRSLKHYLVLAALCCSVLFSLGTALIIVRTPMPRRWWLAALALVSFGTIQFNWSAGQSMVLPAYFSLFGGSVIKAGPVAPWIVSVGLPLGACIALWRRADFRKRQQTPRTAAPIGSTPAKSSRRQTG